jgi:penicillin-insensitive murein DD-endopeptidase
MKKLIPVFLSIIFIWLIIYFGNDILRKFESGKSSQSIGTVDKGKLINGKRLPTKGNNVITYSRFGSLLGRNTVNQKVRDAILNAYEKVYRLNQKIHFVIGETSWPNGGKFWPHKSHQNGLSVDFMVPIKNSSGESVPIPSNIFNKFGYGIEFDSLGRYKDITIDFEAMGLHLLQLKKAAEENGLRIDVVIFDNALQNYLFKTKYGKELKESIRFSKLKPWIRHDEHYHVNFKL